MIKSLWAFLGSIRFVIPLLILLTGISIIGIVIPQGLPSEYYLEKLGPLRGGIIVACGLGHVFSTLWFYSLLGLLSLSILVCSSSRLWHNIGRSMKAHFLADSEAVSRLKTTQNFKSTLAPERAGVRAQSFLKSRLFICRQKIHEDGAIQVSGHAGLLKEIGSYIFHLGLVLLFVGGLVGRIGGYTYEQKLQDGQSAPVRDRPFSVRSDWFKLSLNDDGTVKDYTSHLSIISNQDNALLAEKVIEVNSPLSWGGIRFYQSSYGQSPGKINSCELRISGPDLGSEGHTGRWTSASALELPNGIRVSVLRYVADFMIDMETKEVASRSAEANNPAVHLLFMKDDDTIQTSWVFANFPEMHNESKRYSSSLIAMEPAYYTGIQIVKNPGVPLIWVGIIIMSIAIFFVFYVPRKNIWIMITAHKAGSKILVGGLSNRLPEKFQVEFQHLCNALATTMDK